MLTFHTETLQRDEVWSRVAATSRWMQGSGVAATYFVYPFPAEVAGVDIAPRVASLAAGGHEIAQHTHFYAGDRISKEEKKVDLSDDNVVGCIVRDAAHLRTAGMEPRGFVAGAWHVTDAVLDALATEGFAYDCSARAPVHGYGNGGAPLEWMDAPSLAVRANGTIVRIPTLCSLGEWFKWGRRTTTEGAEPFQVVYLHDYELLRFRTRAMLKLFVRLNRDRMTTVGARTDPLVGERP